MEDGNVTEGAKVFRADKREGLVQECLFTALMQLLQNKRLDNISIKELCDRAGVSRMSFYRSYSTKQDILTSHIDYLFADYLRDIARVENLSIQSFALGFCAYWRANRPFIEALINQNLAFLLMEKFTRYLEMLFGIMLFADEREKVSHYEVSYRAGGLYAVLIDWAQNGFTESDENIAGLIEDLSEGYHVASR